MVILQELTSAATSTAPTLAPNLTMANHDRSPGSVQFTVYAR
jgi:hypothetical protein